MLLCVCTVYMRGVVYVGEVRVDTFKKEVKRQNIKQIGFAWVRMGRMKSMISVIGEKDWLRDRMGINRTDWAPEKLDWAVLIFLLLYLRR